MEFRVACAFFGLSNGRVDGIACWMIFPVLTLLLLDHGSDFFPCATLYDDANYFGYDTFEVPPLTAEDEQVLCELRGLSDDEWP